ncbi:hypothetical protein IAG41_12910 [Sphingomonas sp. JC676]|uniref:hypothetical protein n=1 Tax=Sphingomonas sp. JC676 TaxID=2768065 RepID=UPI001657E5A5|nr:hypothetical protein [Sphingomonas sp. JC676]MBC9033292.1 hypothetical protein [Sphingomonas sp. JC676]
MPSFFALLLMTAAPDPHPGWMVGRWQYIGPSQRPGEACNGDGGGDQVVFSRRGYWIGIAIGDYGKWWIRGDTLFQRVIEPGDGAMPTDRGTTFNMRFRRASDHALRLSDGGWMIRCGRDVTGWFAPGTPH